jgi:tetratricopeptide (TPR) repeat protein
LEHYAISAQRGNEWDWLPVNHANLLSELRRFDEALPLYRRASEKGPDLPWADHNIAYYLERQGRFTEAVPVWRRACEKYEALLERKDVSLGEERPDVLRHYASILVVQYENDEAAEKRLREALEIAPNHTGALASLAELLRDRVEQPNLANKGSLWESEALYRRCKALLQKRIADGADFAVWLELAELHLVASVLTAQDVAASSVAPSPSDHAEGCYLNVVEGCPEGRAEERAAALCGLGVLSTRAKDHARAAGYFERALRVSPANLKIMSNLAESYFKLQQTERAEEKYREVLRISSDHVESNIGLGEIFSASAEGGETDDYEVAKGYFTRAIELGRSRHGSKVLKAQELAAVYYSRGYTRVKAYEGSKLLRSDALEDARRDFETCLSFDKGHFKAARALARVRQRLDQLSAASFAQESGPRLLLGISFALLLGAQALFLIKRIDAPSYATMSLGSLFFVVVALYLPQLLKLKVGGLELEKSPVDQIGVGVTLGIKK